jgi:ABC-type multidrug transport system permease subunit
MSIALITSFTSLNLGNSSQGLPYRIFAIFIVTIVPANIISQSEPTYIKSRAGYLKPRGASRISPRFKGLPLTSLSFLLLAGLFRDVLYLRYSRSLS